jgi:hypothetical protein
MKITLYLCSGVIENIVRNTNGGKDTGTQKSFLDT